MLVTILQNLKILVWKKAKMKDFKIIDAKILLTVTGVAPVRGFFPPSIIVTGFDLNKAEQIFYNGIEIQDFIVSSNDRLMVRIPTEAIGKELREIRVTSSTQLVGKDALIKFSLPSQPKTISGIERLVQSWMIIFNTTPGSDIFDPSSGGGVKTIIGVASNGQKKSSAATDLAMAVEKTKSEMIKLQSRSSGLPPEEKLLSASLGTVSFNPNTSTLTGTIILTNMVGATGQVSIG
jgi:hypothetical protein